jgi:hypothetical protein
MSAEKRPQHSRLSDANSPVKPDLSIDSVLSISTNSLVTAQPLANTIVDFGNGIELSRKESADSNGTLMPAECPIGHNIAVCGHQILGIPTWHTWPRLADVPKPSPRDSGNAASAAIRARLALLQACGFLRADCEPASCTVSAATTRCF